MSKLTKEYLDKKFSELDEKFVSKEHLDQKFTELDQKFVELGEKFVAKEFFEEQLKPKTTLTALKLMLKISKLILQR
jgi:hypothetical protein